MSEMLEEHRKVLVVVAHPDDAEFGCGASLAKWAREGREVRLLLCTNGDKGTSDRSLTSPQIAAIRAVEAAEAGKALGLVGVDILGHPDGFLQETVELQEKVVRAIRTFQPDVVVCQDPTRRIGGVAQHRDHRVAGSITLDSVYPAARDFLNFPEHLAEGIEPWKVAEVWITGAEHPDVFVDVSETIDAKIESLRCHKSQIGDMDAIATRLREGVETVGKAAGLPMAESFKRIVYRR